MSLYKPYITIITNRTKRKRNEINYLDGQIGVYRRGVQMIGNKAIKKSLKK